MKKLFPNFFKYCVMILLIFNSVEYSMAAPKNVKVQLNLSGNKISFKSPVNYSKDFSWPKETEYNINIYDKDNYTLFENSHVIRKSYWDYGKGLFFGGVKGTLSMTLVLYKAIDKDKNLKNDNEFIKALESDFKDIYDEQTRSKPETVLPEEYQLKKISNKSIGYYEFVLDGDKHLVYGIPLSTEHYLMVGFNFINNSEGKKNNWKEQAQDTVDFIMSSLEVK